MHKLQNIQPVKGSPTALTIICGLGYTKDLYKNKYTYMQIFLNFHLAIFIVLRGHAKSGQMTI